jgi:hypothetical protein
MKFQPHNRRLIVEKVELPQRSTAIVDEQVPKFEFGETWKPAGDVSQVYRVVAKSRDCSAALAVGTNVIVDETMLVTKKVAGEEITMILENYIEATILTDDGGEIDS